MAVEDETQQQQLFKVEVYDNDDASHIQGVNDLNQHDFIGSYEF